MKFVLIKFSCLIWFVRSLKSFCECNKKIVQWLNFLIKCRSFWFNFVKNIILPVICRVWAMITQLAVNSYI